MRLLPMLCAAVLFTSGGFGAARAEETPRKPVLFLNVAYHAIGRAEALGAQGRYLDAARRHYRAALDRFGRRDRAGAVAEAHVAWNLADAAIDEHPIPAPNDIPAPPALTMALGFQHRLPQSLDTARLAMLLKIENTAEAHELANSALDANIASQRADLASNVQEAKRERMLGFHLAAAVRSLAYADHPELFRRMHRDARHRHDGHDSHEHDAKLL
jgi:hypothetical protein